VRSRGHPREPFGAAPAQQAEQDGLGLVVERVRREHRPRVARARRLVEELVTRAPRRLLKVIARLLHTLRQRRATDQALEAVPAREPLDPARVVRARLAAQPVVEVRRRQINLKQPDPLQLFEREQQRRRVRPARDRDQHALAAEGPAPQPPLAQKPARELARPALGS
jgi:hypothetical protein